MDMSLIGENEMKIYKLLFCISVLSSAFVFSEEKTSHKDKSLVLAEKAIMSAVKVYDPNVILTFEYPTSSKSLIVKYKTRKFMVHSRSMIGKYAEKAEEQEGPSYQGFLLRLYLQEAGTVNQAVVPQTIKEPYWQTDLNVTMINKTEQQFFWGLLYGTQTKNGLLLIVKKAINSLGRPYLEDELTKQNSVKNRWFRETYLTTQRRLKDVNKPQTVYGRVDPGIVSELYKSDKEPGVISIMRKKFPRGWASFSMVIDGAYSLGQIEPGEYEVIILSETADHPAITVQNFEMKKDQPPLRLDLNFGKASAAVRVYDKDGNPVDSDEIELKIAGTANRTTYKHATGINNGVWRVDHLYEGRYYARARWNDIKVGGFFELVKGNNEVVLKFKE
jgi:hypothetical protein